MINSINEDQQNNKCKKEDIDKDFLVEVIKRNGSCPPNHPTCDLCPIFSSSKYINEKKFICNNDVALAIAHKILKE